MAKSKTGRPEWFKFWRRNRAMLDDEEMFSHESCGIIFINMMRYFDDEEKLLPMNQAERIAFNLLKSSIDEAVTSFSERSETNKENGSKGGRPKKEPN